MIFAASLPLAASSSVNPPTTVISALVRTFASVLVQTFVAALSSVLVQTSVPAFGYTPAPSLALTRGQPFPSRNLTMSFDPSTSTSPMVLYTMLRHLGSTDIHQLASLMRPSIPSLSAETTDTIIMFTNAALFLLAWTIAYLLSRLCMQAMKEPLADHIPPLKPPQRTRRLQCRLLRRSIPWQRPTGNDPGWCFLTLASITFRPYLTGLGFYPSPVKVLNTLHQLGAPLRPTLITLHRGTDHVEDGSGPYTARRLLRSRRIGAKLKIGQHHHPGDCEPFEIPILLFRNKDNLHALVDTGATGYGFIDASFAHSRGYSTEPLPTPRQLQVIDGRPIASGAITHSCKLRLEVGAQVEGISLFVTQLGDTKVVLGLPWLQHHAAKIQFADRSISFHADRCRQHTAALWASTLASSPLTAATATLPPPPIPPRSTATTTLPPPPIPPRPTAPRRTIALSAARFHREAQQPENHLFLLAARPAGPNPTSSNPTEELVPTTYHQYLHLFQESEAQALPIHRYIDHEIPLQEGKQPPFGPLYSMSSEELKTLREYLDDQLTRGYICSSSSPAGAPVLFIKKKDGSLRLCVDYRALNALTVKNRYPLPLINDTLDRLKDTKIYTKLDLRNGYNQIRIKEGEEWKTAFQTRYGLFEYLVMPFGLTNAPATFQVFMNDTLRTHLDDFCTVYLDDILICSNTEEEHQRHFNTILDKLQAAGLHCKPEKCEFHVDRTEYLGYIISGEGVTMATDKTKAIQEWKTPTSVHDIQVFLGFANFYRRFIRDYSKVVSPMTNILKKDAQFVWTPAADHAFNQLKEAFTTAPILKHFDPERACILETDASNFVAAAVLSQKDDQGILHPVAFYSHKMMSAECNYDISDKELLVIVRAFEEWRKYLEPSNQEITVHCDHKNLEHFMSTKILNRRQNGKPDALTRRSGDLPKEGDERLTQQHQVILKPKNLRLAAALEVPRPAKVSPARQNELQAALANDPLSKQLMKDIIARKKHSRFLPIGECAIKDGLLYYQGLLYIPDDATIKLEIFRTNHDAPPAGHPGRARTLELLSRNYYWPQMQKYVAHYVDHYDACTRIKPARYAPYGLLKPLAPPVKPWSSLSMDHITGLPESQGSNAILVVVDRLTKMAHYIPTRDTADAPELATYSYNNTVQPAGYQTSIQYRLPPTNRRTDRRSKCNHGTILAGYVNYQQDNWAEFLPLAEFAHNNATTEPLRVSPFFANYGYNPQLDILPTEERHDATPKEVLEFANLITTLQTALRSEILYAQATAADSANTTRLPEPRLEVGDLLPPSMKSHPVFQVSLLEPVRMQPLPGHIQPPPPPVIVEREEEFEVQEVLDSRIRHRQLQYLVKWTGYEQPTWEPARNLDAELGSLQRFHSLYPTKPALVPKRALRGKV
ncbi:uncharacterized protein H6S33_000004 [Morchella sextelata]|uniref:uncharacterized protein n=1 Tax=Morchella sextelata TaxID=1174677 RepID=UPI001D0560AB|nr:uncharacterized protein H6S33_000004 [Morchella sextelata]KAH0614368.1 hypothetical protein H6S33_000004 [Morchella sextelata]